MLEQSELNFKSRQTHLEGQLLRAQDALETKSATIQELEENLRGGGNDEQEGIRQQEHLQRLDETNRVSMKFKAYTNGYKHVSKQPFNKFVSS